MFRESDFVVCSLPGTTQTFKFVGPEEIDAMRSNCVFISIGRGTAVDEVALASALRSNRIRGAGLDVFQEEPLPTESPLWALDNALITAHNADLTAQYGEQARDAFLRNLNKFMVGEELETVVDKSAGY